MFIFVIKKIKPVLSRSRNVMFPMPRVQTLHSLKGQIVLQVYYL